MTKLEIIDKAIDTFASKNFALEWLATPNPILGMAQPSDLLQTQSGRKAVDELLNRIKYGDLS